MLPYRKPLEVDLERIRTLFLQMCVRAEAMLVQAMRAVTERDPHLARHVMGMDREIDDLEVEVDSRCLKCLALRNPVGRDLRMITTVMKMVTDVERIGDLAVNIAERGLDVGGKGVEPGERLEHMAELVVGMVRTATDAFVQEDGALARELIARDDEVDRLNLEAFAFWSKTMATHADQVDRALAFSSVTKTLERIGDHAVNLAKMVIFLVEGEDVRHGRLGDLDDH